MLSGIQDAGSQFISRDYPQGRRKALGDVPSDSNVGPAFGFSRTRKASWNGPFIKTRINVPDQGARVGKSGAPVGSAAKSPATALYDAIYPGVR